jgi:hypothetical protein
MRKSHLEHPVGIESGHDFLERIAVQFGLDCLDAIEDTTDPNLASEYVDEAATTAHSRHRRLAKKPQCVGGVVTG